MVTPIAQTQDWNKIKGFKIYDHSDLQKEVFQRN